MQTSVSIPDDLVRLMTDPESEAVLVAKSEYLLPAAGKDVPFFPPTFAAPQEDKEWTGYNIDELPDGKNTCLLDSVPSQANRMEAIFHKRRYASLVPHVLIDIEEAHTTVNLLDVGHRAADALVRFSEAALPLNEAFKRIRHNNDYEALARIAPTSILFGCWDSRGTGVKLQRIIGAEIRAYNVRLLHRSSTYQPTFDYIGAGIFDESIRDIDEYSEEGFAHVPASWKPGGVMLMDGGFIRRVMWLNLSALRAARCSDEQKTQQLREYLLGLALVLLTATPDLSLREGCVLTFDPAVPPTTKLVYVSGKQDDLAITHQQAYDFAKQAAERWGIAQETRFKFNAQLARQTIAAKAAARKKQRSNQAKSGKRGGDQDSSAEA